MESFEGFRKSGTFPTVTAASRGAWRSLPSWTCL